MAVWYPIGISEASSLLPPLPLFSASSSFVSISSLISGQWWRSDPSPPLARQSFPWNRQLGHCSPGCCFRRCCFISNASGGRISIRAGLEDGNASKRSPKQQGRILMEALYGPNSFLGDAFPEKGTSGDGVQDGVHRFLLQSTCAFDGNAALAKRSPKGRCLMESRYGEGKSGNCWPNSSLGNAFPDGSAFRDGVEDGARCFPLQNTKIFEGNTMYVKRSPKQQGRSLADSPYRGGKVGNYWPNSSLGDVPLKETTLEDVVEDGACRFSSQSSSTFGRNSTPSKRSPKQEGRPLMETPYGKGKVGNYGPNLSLEDNPPKESPSKRSPQQQGRSLMENPNVEGKVENYGHDSSLGDVSPKESAFGDGVEDGARRVSSQSTSAKNKEGGFERRMEEGKALLKEGSSGLLGDIELGVAECMLYKAADSFASAAVIDPSSLEALGYWGNTLLIHGELKYKAGKELKEMLSTLESESLRSRRMSKEERIWRERERLEIEMSLQFVCEESEKLLVEAGRKYRMALALDRNDARSLYNWGLALCYRANLIADEGGEGAIADADKVFIAAIDKFKALMKMGKKYASGALLNWGLALQDRSRLFANGSEERMKSLQQAGKVFEEALLYDPNYTQARSAIAACVVELEEQEFKQYESQQRRFQ